MNLNKRIEQFQTPLTEELLLKHNFFELYPFDGGGSFIYHELVGSVDDRKAAECILNGGVMDDFGGLEHLDYRRFECWRTIEKSCWINRMYFIVPLARTARLDNNHELAAKVLHLILDYLRRNPAPDGLDAVVGLERRVLESRDRDYNQGGNLDGKTEYQWFDFQPASRIINTLNSMYLLRDFSSIGETDWNEFDQWIRVHAETIYLAEAHCCELAPGNHQALRGLALLYGAAYFAGEDFAAAWAREGERICNYHMIHDYLSDGTLIDISPSYHVFETWIGRDIVNLADYYGFQISHESRQMLQKSSEICRTFRQPDGGSIVIDDGYSLNMDVFLQTIDIAMEPAVTAMLPESRMAFYRDQRFFVMLDASPNTARFSHYHGGKNAITLWFNDKPFCVDSGCCNYDDKEFAAWFKQSEAHSSLLIDGVGDSILRGNYDWQITAETRMTPWRGHIVESLLTSDVPQWQGMKWNRQIEIGTKIVIIDTVSADQTHRLDFIFNLHPDVKAEITGDHILLSNGNTQVYLDSEANSGLEWTLRPSLVFCDFKKCPSFQLVASTVAANLTLKTIWSG